MLCCCDVRGCLKVANDFSMLQSQIEIAHCAEIAFSRRHTEKCSKAIKLKCFLCITLLLFKAFLKPLSLTITACSGLQYGPGKLQDPHG